MNNNIKVIVEKKLCTGCGTCAAICPTNAIEIRINDKKGTYHPILDSHKCVRCGLCFRICPGHEVDFKQLNQSIFNKQPEDIILGNYLRCYVGHANSQGIRYYASSGGVITAILVAALKNKIITGALVTRMKKDKPLEPEPFIARTEGEIIEASCSKYCPVPANVALKEILDSCEGEKFAVVGLPCHIQAVRKAALFDKNIRSRILLHLGLFCNHSPSFFATEYVLWKNKIDRHDVTRISYRGEGWPGKMRVQFNNENTVHINFPAYWNQGFGFGYCPERCFSCIDQANELADCSFGDAWDLSQDSVGTSFIIVRNKNIIQLLQQLANDRDISLSIINRSSINKVGIRHLAVANITLQKLFRNTFPVYNRELPKTHINNYVKLIQRYILVWFGSKKRLWPLLSLVFRIKANRS